MPANFFKGESMNRYSKINCVDDDQNMYTSIMLDDENGEYVKYSEAKGIIHELQEALKQEREECALVCDAISYKWSEDIDGDDCILPEDCAEAIRARSKEWNG